MLELGKAGSAGTAKGVVPVLRDGAVVATLHPSDRKGTATVVVGDREWVFAKNKRDLTGRWAVEPEDAVRVRASQTSMWKGTWTVGLEGTPVEVQTASRWKGTHRYLVGDRTLAESGSTGGWAPRPTLTADIDVPLHHQVFLLWVERVIGGHSGDGSAAVFGGSDGGGGGGGCD